MAQASHLGQLALVVGRVFFSRVIYVVVVFFPGV